MTYLKSTSFVLFVILLWNAVFVNSTPYKQRSSIFNNLNEALVDDDLPEFPKEFIDIVSKGYSEEGTGSVRTSFEGTADFIINQSSEKSERQFPPTSTSSSPVATVTTQESKTNEENENSSDTPVLESPIVINIVNEKKIKEQPIIIKLMPESSKNGQDQGPIIPIYTTVDNEDIDKKGNNQESPQRRQDEEESVNQLPSPPALREHVDENNELHINVQIIPSANTNISTTTTTMMTTTGTTIESSSSSSTATSIPLYIDPIFPAPEFTEENKATIAQEHILSATTSSTFDRKNDGNETTENQLTPEISFPLSAELDNENERSRSNGSEIGKRSQDNNDYNDDDDADDDTIEPTILELKPLKGPPCPGFIRQCNSYFDCDFHPNGADENDTRTWFKCDGKHCICELLGYIRDDEAEWSVSWSKKNQKCISDLDGPCGVNEGLEIHCPKAYQCINNVCDNPAGVKKIHKERKNKAHKGSQNDNDTITEINVENDTETDCANNNSRNDHGNIFSLLFFPHMNIFDSILNDSLNSIREMF